MDPDTERFSLIDGNAHRALSAYKQNYDENKKETRETTMAILLERVTPPPEEPQAGPPGGGPGEGSVILETTVLCMLLHLKTLPGDKTWRWETVVLVIPTRRRPRLTCGP